MKLNNVSSLYIYINYNTKLKNIFYIVCVRGIKCE
jgi:hypothetical protein